MQHAQNMKEIISSSLKKISDKHQRTVGGDLIELWVSFFEKCDIRDIERAFNDAVALDRFPSISDVKGLVKKARELREESERGPEIKAEIDKRQKEYDERRNKQAQEAKERKKEPTFSTELQELSEKWHSKKTIGMPDAEVQDFANGYVQDLKAFYEKKIKKAKPDWNSIYNEKLSLCWQIRQNEQDEQDKQALREKQKTE